MPCISPRNRKASWSRCLSFQERPCASRSGLLVDRIGAKKTGVMAQLIVMAASRRRGCWASRLPGSPAHGRGARLCRSELCGGAPASGTLVSAQYAGGRDGSGGGWECRHRAGCALCPAARGGLTAGECVRPGADPGDASCFSLYIDFLRGSESGSEGKKALRLPESAQGQGRALVLLLLHGQLRRLRGAGEFLRALFQE